MKNFGRAYHTFELSFEQVIVPMLKFCIYAPLAPPGQFVVLRQGRSSSQLGECESKIWLEIQLEVEESYRFGLKQLS